MKEIIMLLPPLGVAVLLNIALGTWYNMDITKIKFNRNKLLNGLFKSFLICLGFVGATYIVDAVPMIANELPILPMVVMLSAIALYTKKFIAHLVNILGTNKALKEGK